MEASEFDASVSAVAVLDQPLRRALYRLLVERGDWVGRDDAADAVHAPRSVVAFHLEKLVDAGLLDVRYERMSGRAGPGAGRPAKLYRRAGREVSVSLPERHYDLVARLLAEGVEEAAASGRPVIETLAAVARREGMRVGVAARSAPEPATAALDRLGYEPAVSGDEVVLRNCPFHALAEEHRSLVCGMNHSFLAGFVAGLSPEGSLSAKLEPTAGGCCVRLNRDRNERASGSVVDR